MAAIRLTGVVFDSPDPASLAQFYARLLGVEVAEGGDDTWVMLHPQTGGPHLSFQLEPDYVRPVWPATPGRQQMSLHLDLQVDDLDAATAFARECGAVVAEFQPQLGVVVMLDPDGHPFCLFTD